MDSLSVRQCARCGATWVNGAHRWATGKPGSELDLAGLVCNTVDDPQCINPCKGQEGGQTWAMRQAGASVMAVTIEQGCQQPQAGGR